MATYVFTGRVMPERANVNVSAFQVQLLATDAGVSGNAIVSIDVSQVSVMLNTETVNVDLHTLKNYMEYIVRNLVDALGYLSGCGYDVEITSVTEPDGKQTVFGVGILELGETKRERPLEFPKLIEVINKSQHLRRALGDLREAIRSSSDTGFFCYRAIECIRQSFKREEDGKDDSPSWERLRDALCIDRSWINYLIKFAKPQRHGETPYMSGKDRDSAMQHAWKVVDRFCVYVQRGFQKLPENEFGMLK